MLDNRKQLQLIGESH